MLLKKKPKTLLDLLRPDPTSVARQSQEKQVENQKSAKLRQFVLDQSVWFRSFSKNSPPWSLGKVVQVLGPLTYLVKADGRTYKRHVDHILDGEVVQSQPNPESDVDDDDDSFSLGPVEVVPEPEVHPRYPVRQRRPPDFYRPQN
ncbi:unnamed protein product [Orchesella dallaii]|uniref:Uncharacterized protein n=1 Tax=Orchesella dallaii TaxID=48710 RepID=A0ABP1QFG8_9HEXA